MVKGVKKELRENGDFNEIDWLCDFSHCKQIGIFVDEILFLILKKDLYY